MSGMNCQENRYFFVIRGAHFKVTKHQVLKKYLENADILSDYSANILGKARLSEGGKVEGREGWTNWREGGGKGERREEGPRAKPVTRDLVQL